MASIRRGPPCGGHAHNKDTGGDCRTDGDEVRDGTDPNSYTTDPSDACRDMAVNAMVTDQTSLAGIVPQPV